MDIHELIERDILPKIKQPIWDNWYIKEKIGSGAFSSVYRLEAHTSTVDERALKITAIVADRSFGTPEGMNSYLTSRKATVENEMVIMKTLADCPHIVRYFDEKQEKLYIDGEERGFYNLISMELLTPLPSQMHSRMFAYTEENVLRLACEIGQALQYAHRHNIIHRDVKFDNLFVSKSGLYKLGDFNVSKLGKDAHTMAGAPGYMAPEVYIARSDPNESYSVQADIYSLGICLYQLMNDRFFPLEDETTPESTAIEMRIQGASFLPPRNASETFGNIIMKACAYNPKLRYASMDDMLADLESLKQGKHVSRVPDSNRTIYAGNSSDAEIQANSSENGHVPLPDSNSVVHSKTQNTFSILIAICCLVLLIGFLLLGYLWSQRHTDSEDELYPLESETTEMTETDDSISSEQTEYTVLESTEDSLETTIVTETTTTEEETSTEQIIETTPETEDTTPETVFTTLPEMNEPIVTDNVFVEPDTEVVVIPSTEVAESEKRYEVYDVGLTWMEAAARCEEMGGHLVTISDSEEQRIIESLLKNVNREQYWIGLYQENGVWKWIDGTPYTYTNWDYDEYSGYQKPDNFFGDEFFVRIAARTTWYEYWQHNFGKWDDSSNGAGGESDDEADAPLTTFGFICEWD